MPASGSCIFTDADAYQASLHDMLDLVVPEPGKFYARLTWVELPILHLLRAREAAPRVAYVSLPAERVFVTFLTRQGSQLICDGTELQFGDIMFHTPGERFHQRTTAATSWGSISLTPASLAAFGRTLSGRDPVLPPFGCILRPSREDRGELLRPHAQAGRIAETQLNHIAHSEVARALEQDLVWALVNCLASGEPRGVPTGRRRHAAIVARFEASLTSAVDALSIPEICRMIGVPSAMLRASCTQILGMGPARYLRLRRRHQAGPKRPRIKVSLKEPREGRER